MPQGVTLIGLDEGAKLSGLQRIVENDANSATEDDPGTDGPTDSTAHNYHAQNPARAARRDRRCRHPVAAAAEPARALAHEVGEIKRMEGSAVFRPEREAPR